MAFAPLELTLLRVAMSGALSPTGASTAKISVVRELSIMSVGQPITVSPTAGMCHVKGTNDGCHQSAAYCTMNCRAKSCNVGFISFQYIQSADDQAADCCADGSQLMGHMEWSPSAGA